MDARGIPLIKALKHTISLLRANKNQPITKRNPPFRWLILCKKTWPLENKVPQFYKNTYLMSLKPLFVTADKIPGPREGINFFPRIGTDID